MTDLRLPAYGRHLRAALKNNLRPIAGGGCVVLTTCWDYAKAFARLVCDSNESADLWDFSMLAGLDVIVIVPSRDQVLGEQLRHRAIDSGACVAVLSIVQEAI